MSVNVTIPTLTETIHHEFPAGTFDFVLGWIREGNFLYGTNIDGDLIRIDKTSFATHSILQFDPHSQHIRATDLVYVRGSTAANDRIYVVFANDTSLVVASVNPNPTPMTYTDVITLSGGQGSASITADANYLYVIRSSEEGGGDVIVRRFTLDGNFTATTLTLASYRAPRCIRAAGDMIYVSGYQRSTAPIFTSWIIRIDALTFATFGGAIFDRGSPQSDNVNDVAVTAEHIWTRHTTGAIRKQLLTSLYRPIIGDVEIVDIINTGINSACSCVTASLDGQHVWALFENGQLVRIHTSTNEQRTYTLPPEDLDHFSNIVTEGTSLYMVRYQAGTWVSKYVIPEDSAAFKWVIVNPASTGQESGWDIATDTQGNIYMHGRTSTGFYLVKYTPAGHRVWERTFGVGGNARRIAVDSGGNPFIIGEYTGQANLGGSTLPGFLSGLSIYVAKYSTVNGAHLWSMGFDGGFQGQNYGQGIAIDSSGNPVITGYAATANFGVTTVSGIFIAKLSGIDGSEIWARGYSSGGWGKAVAIDSAGFIWGTGFYQSSINFGGGVMTSTGAQSMFVVKLTSGGLYSYQNTYGNFPRSGSAADQPYGGRAIAITSSNDVIIGGAFTHDINFGGELLSKPGTENPDMFIVRFTSAGAFVWQRRMPSGYGNINGLAIDSGSSNIAVGCTSISTKFGDDDTITVGFGAIAKYTINNGFVWARGYNTNNAVNGISIDPFGHIVGTGVYQIPCDFGGGIRTPVGATDLFILKVGA